jgi:hypothetical protein
MRQRSVSPAPADWMMNRKHEALDRAFAQAAQQRADAVLIGAHPFFNVHMDRRISENR